MNGLFKLFLIFFKIGAFTFGGGYAMLPIIYRELCEERDIIPQAEMEEIVVLSQAMPGALAVNCATQTGYKLYGNLCLGRSITVISYYSLLGGSAFKI